MKNIKTIIFIGIISLVFFKPSISLAALSVTTGTADNITDTGATLHGTGSPDLTLNPKLPTTVYFRYSNTQIAPVFCNEIYGNNMVSTGDIVLNPNSGSQSFYQDISGLQDNTTYHYCAIISNKKPADKGGIVYGTVKSFTTPPCATCAQTTVTTKNATGVGSTSATINGSYSSTEAVKTYFEYKKDTTLMNASGNQAIKAPTSWIRVDEKNHSANTFGNRNFYLSGLEPHTKYNFVFKATTSIGLNSKNETFSGSILSFVTNSNNGGGGLTDTSDTTTTTFGSGSGVNVGTTTNNFGGGTTPPVYGTGAETTPPLVIGSTATPPGDATVHYHEGIETVFARQIIADKNLAKIYGYTEGTDLQSFAWTLSDFFAKVFGYVSDSGREIRVSQPDIAAYQIKIVGNKLTVYEYYNSKIVNIQNITSTFKSAYDYEYYFKK